jgi:hypothetical protein
VTLLRDLFLFLFLHEPEPAGIAFCVSRPGLYLRFSLSTDPIHEQNKMCKDDTKIKNIKFNFSFTKVSDDRQGRTYVIAPRVQ